MIVFPWKALKRQVPTADALSNDLPEQMWG